MKRPMVHEMVRSASRMTMLNEREITGEGRQRVLVRVRWAIMLIAREYGFSFPHIGRALGGRDHSTVWSGVDQAKYLVERDAGFRALVDHLRSVVQEEARRERVRLQVTFSGASWAA